MFIIVNSSQPIKLDIIIVDFVKEKYDFFIFYSSIHYNRLAINIVVIHDYHWPILNKLK